MQTALRLPQPIVAANVRTLAQFNSAFHSSLVVTKRVRFALTDEVFLVPPRPTTPSTTTAATDTSNSLSDSFVVPPSNPPSYVCYLVYNPTSHSYEGRFFTSFNPFAPTTPVPQHLAYIYAPSN